MSCFICKRTGIRTCDPEEAETLCDLCGFCSREAIRKQFEQENK